MATRSIFFSSAWNVQGSIKKWPTLFQTFRTDQPNQIGLARRPAAVWKTANFCSSMAVFATCLHTHTCTHPDYYHFCLSRSSFSKYS